MITFLQGSTIHVLTGAPVSAAMAFGINLTAGSYLLACAIPGIAQNSNSIFDSSGNAWTKLFDNTFGALYGAPTIAGVGAKPTVTIGFPANASSIGIFLAEYAGVDLVNPVDVVSAMTFLSSTTAFTTSSVTTTKPNDAVLGFGFDFEPNGDVLTPGAGWNVRFTDRLPVVDSRNVLIDKITTSAGAYQPNGTYSAPCNAVHGVTIALAAAVGSRQRMLTGVGV